MKNICKRILALLLALLLTGCAAAPAAETEAPAEPETTAAPETTEAPAEPPAEPEPTETPTEAETEPPTYVVSEDDLQELRSIIEQNEEVRGMLLLGKEGKFPVAQGEDNAFYLEHDSLKNEEWHGSLFFDCRCSLEPRDTNLLLYGKNLKDGTFFSTLPNYYQPSYLQAYPLFVFATLNGVEVYVPYGITDINADPEAEDYFKCTEFNLSDEQAFRDYTGYLTEHSRYALPVTAEPGDVLLTLLTDNYAEDVVDGKLLICLRLLRADETPEDMLALFAEALEG